jgi:superfamily II helicase
MPKFKVGDRVIEVRRKLIYDILSISTDMYKVRIIQHGSWTPFAKNEVTEFFIGNADDDELYYVYLANLQFDKDLKDLLEE